MLGIFATLNVTFNGFHEVPFWKQKAKKEKKKEKWKQLQISNTLEVKPENLLPFRIFAECLFIFSQRSDACVVKERKNLSKKLNVTPLED